jgi:hypothetical protein
MLLAGLLCLAQAPVFAGEAAAPEGTPIPAALHGTWRITGVLVDTGTIRRLRVEHNDPGYMGHLLLISPDAVLGAINRWGEFCLAPTVTVKPTTAGALIKDTMGGRARAPGHTAEELAQLPPETPTPHDYQLPYTENSPVEPMWFNCGKGGIGGWDAPIGQSTWMLALPDGKLGIRWMDSSIVVLSRATEPVEPVASFNCAKARTPVEKTICGTLELGLIDHGAINRYRSDLEILERRARLAHEPRYLGAERDLEGVHRAWRKRRDSCGPDVACLKKSLLELWDILDKTPIPDF